MQFFILQNSDIVLSVYSWFSMLVVPGCLQNVKAQYPFPENQLLPGCTVKEFKLEVCLAFLW